MSLFPSSNIFLIIEEDSTILTILSAIGIKTTSKSICLLFCCFQKSAIPVGRLIFVAYSGHNVKKNDRFDKPAGAKLWRAESDHLDGDQKPVQDKGAVFRHRKATPSR
ncbi:MAG: hypothetical protein C0407_16680 [Desulfobacca sp.]|nr:hypothetical protein [Desulfobacca sp.]